MKPLNNFSLLDCSYYLLFDSAKSEANINRAVHQNKLYQSLYKGRSEEDLADVAPYLFSFEFKSNFSNWYLENGWGNSWGVFVQSQCDFEQVYTHFRKFLLVKTENGQELYFRFYDPRVLKIFLPTCDKKQIIEFFGPVESFIVEGDTKEEAILFEHENGILRQKVLQASSIFGTISPQVAVE